MKNKAGLTKRAVIRIISFASAAMLALGGAAYYGYSLSVQYRTELEYNYHRALNDLSDYMSNIYLLLQKSAYANTGTALTAIAAELYRDTGSAKCCISRLPLSDEYFSNLTKFLSQTGEFSLELAKKTLRGGEVTEEDKNMLSSLESTAAEVSVQIGDIQAVASEKKFRGSSIAEEIKNGESADMLRRMDKSIEGENEDTALFPVLVYDGYYSDHIEGQEPKATEGSSDITKPFAKELAARTLKLDASSLEDAEDSDGDIPYYGFRSGDISVSITKKGGYPLYFTNTRAISEPALNYEQACGAAVQYLADMGLGKFNVDYYYVSEGVLNAAMSYVDVSSGRDVICYPDVITVGIALDSGEAVSFNAAEYIKSHKSRDVSVVKHSEEEARQTLSANLTPTDTRLCVVALPGYIEALCYEFVCTGAYGEEVQVFVNAGTLEEEKILLRIETAGGNFYK